MSVAVQRQERKEHKDYTDAEKDAGLTALALYSGHSLRASEALTEAGTPIPESTLRSWRKQEPDRYERAQREAMPHVKARLADLHEGLVGAAGTLEAKMLQRLSDEMHELQPKELSGAAKNLAIASGIHSEKGLLYRGEPTQIVERDLHSLRRALASKGFDIDAQVVEEQSDSAQPELSTANPTIPSQSQEQKLGS